MITLAMTNCADYELALDVGAGVPEVVCEEAMQIGQLTRRPELAVASSPGRQERSQLADAVSVSCGQGTTEVEPANDASRLEEGGIGGHISVGNRIDSSDFQRNILGVQRKRSMSNSNGVDPMRLRQLRAIAENLCTLANRHRENHNYVVAHALYGRALSVAQEIHTLEKDGSVLSTRIRTDQQAVFEMLRAGESAAQNTPLEKAQKVGR